MKIVKISPLMLVIAGYLIAGTPAKDVGQAVDQVIQDSGQVAREATEKTAAVAQEGVDATADVAKQVSSDIKRTIAGK